MLLQTTVYTNVQIMKMFPVTTKLVVTKNNLGFHALPSLFLPLSPHMHSLAIIYPITCVSSIHLKTFCHSIQLHSHTHKVQIKHFIFNVHLMNWSPSAHRRPCQPKFCAIQTPTLMQSPQRWFQSEELQVKYRTNCEFSSQLIRFIIKNCREHWWTIVSAILFCSI